MVDKPSILAACAVLKNWGAVSVLVVKLFRSAGNSGACKEDGVEIVAVDFMMEFAFCVSARARPARRFARGGTGIQELFFVRCEFLPWRSCWRLGVMGASCAGYVSTRRVCLCLSRQNGRVQGQSALHHVDQRLRTHGAGHASQIQTGQTGAPASQTG